MRPAASVDLTVPSDHAAPRSSEKSRDQTLVHPPSGVKAERFGYRVSTAVGEVSGGLCRDLVKAKVALHRAQGGVDGSSHAQPLEEVTPQPTGGRADAHGEEQVHI